MVNVNGEEGGEWGVADAQMAASVACSSAQKKKE